VIDTVEILFVVASNLDRRGRRCIIREGGCENTIWPEDDIQDIDIALLGITSRQSEQIREFLGNGEG
jgi:hypothetical protein